MPDYEGGNVFLQVVPSFRGVQRQINDEAKRWGRDAGKDFRENFDREISGRPGSNRPGGGPSSDQTRRQGTEAGGAYADGFRRKLEAATRSLPPVRVGVSTSAAEQELRDLRSDLESLSGETVGIDVDAATAQARVEQLQARLEALGASAADVQVRADVASALAALASVKSLAEVVDRTDATVDIRVRELGDIDSFSGRLIFLGTVITSLAPALVPLTGAAIVGLAGIGSAASAAAGGLGILAAGFKGIGTAVGALGDAQRDAGEDAIQSGLSIATAQRQVSSAQRGLAEARASAADAAVQSAQRITAAQRGVTKAERDAARAADAVTEAREDAARAAEDAARTVGQASRRQEDAERSLGDAQENVRRAQRSLTDARRDAREEIEALALAVRAASLSEEDAELGLVRAREQLLEANADAASLVGDLDFDVELATLNLLRARDQLAAAGSDPAATTVELALAATGVEETQRRLAELEAQRAAIAAGATTDAKEADLGVRQAELRLDEARARNREVQEEAEAARRAGVEGARQVLAAQESLTAARRSEGDAARAVADAEAAVTQARVDGAARVVDAQDAITAAQERAAVAQEAVTTAQQGVTEAYRDAEVQQRQSANSILGAQASLEGAQASLQETYRQTGEVGSAAMQKVADAMSRLSPAGQAFAYFINGLRDEWGMLQGAIQGGLLPGVQAGIEALLPSLPAVTGFVGELATAVGDLFAGAGNAFAGPEWAAFFGFVNDTAPDRVKTLGGAFGDLALGLANLAVAFEPLTNSFITWLTDSAARFATWSAQLGSDEGFQDFVDYILRNGPVVGEFFGSLGDLFVKIVDEMAPFGPVILEILGGIFDFITGLPDGVLSAVVLGILAMVSAFGVLAPIFNFVAGIVAAVTAGIPVLAAVIAALGGPVTIVMAVIAALGAALVAAYYHSETFRAIVDGAFRAVGDAAMWLWTKAIVPAFEGIRVAIDYAMQGAKWAWENVLRPAWSAVAVAAMWLWREVIQPVWSGIQVAIDVASVLIRVALGLVEIFVRTVLAPVFTWLWRNIIEPAWTGIQISVSAAWEFIRPILAALGDFITNDVAPRFRAGVDLIAAGWDLLKEKLKDPIRFVVDTIINKGIVDVFNGLVDSLKLPGDMKVNRVRLPDGFARGGVLPGQSSWRDGDDQLVPMRRGEGVAISEAMRVPALRDELLRWNQIGVQQGEGALRTYAATRSGFALGGIVPQGVGFATGGIAGLLDFGRLLMERGFTVSENAQLGDNPRPGSHSATGYHYKFGNSGAIDVNAGAGESEAEKRALAPVVAEALRLGFGAQFLSSGHYNHAHFDVGSYRNVGDMSRYGAGGGVIGRIAGAVGNAVDFLSPFDGVLTDLRSDVLGSGIGQLAAGVGRSLLDGVKTRISSAVGGLFSNDDEATPTARNVAPGVERWRGTVLQALGMVGQPDAFANTTLRRMMQESGGNPRAINNWDVNASRGTPSKGLMQVIDPTFRAHAFPGYGSDIYDPLSNVLASMRYALSRYGSLPKAYDRKGGYALGGVVDGGVPFAGVYDDGGMIPPGLSMILNGTGAPEPALTTQQLGLLTQAADRPAVAPYNGPLVSVGSMSGPSPQAVVQLLEQKQRVARVRAGMGVR